MRRTGRSAASDSRQVSAASGGTPGTASNNARVLAFLALAALLVGTAAPAATPTPVKPFDFEPLPAETSLPVIGTTRSRPVCTAIRHAIAPAVTAALKSDQSFARIRKSLFGYVVIDSEEARDLHLMQMDREVDKMVKNVDMLESALKAPALDIGPATKPEDASVLRDLRASMAVVLVAQRVQLNAMNGFVETERMRRFGMFGESEQNMQNALGSTIASPSGGSREAPSPVHAFLRASSQAVGGAVTPLHGAHLMDRDLGEISAFTTKYEDEASKIIIRAVKDCT